MLKANLSYYVTRAICAAVNQFDYLNKKELSYIAKQKSHCYHFLWLVRKPDGFRYGFETGLAKTLNTYVSPWLKVENE